VPSGAWPGSMDGSVERLCARPALSCAGMKNSVGVAGTEEKGARLSHVWFGCWEAKLAYLSVNVLARRSFTP